MFSKSIFTFLLLLVSLGLFTYANPINDEGLAVRSLLKDVPADMVEHLERRGGWPKKPCRRNRYALWFAISVAYRELDCDQDFHDVVVSLQESVKVDIRKLGEHDYDDKQSIDD